MIKSDIELITEAYNTIISSKETKETSEPSQLNEDTEVDQDALSVLDYLPSSDED